MGQSMQTTRAGVPSTRGALTVGERAIYVLGGLLLAAAGARPRPNLLLSALAFTAGSYLAWRGAEGSCPVKAAITGPQA